LENLEIIVVFFYLGLVITFIYNRIKGKSNEKRRISSTSVRRFTIRAKLIAPYREPVHFSSRAHTASRYAYPVIHQELLTTQSALSLTAWSCAASEVVESPATICDTLVRMGCLFQQAEAFAGEHLRRSHKEGSLCSREGGLRWLFPTMATTKPACGQDQGAAPAWNGHQHTALPTDPPTVVDVLRSAV
jgi:hypothetical protein